MDIIENHEVALLSKVKISQENFEIICDIRELQPIVKKIYSFYLYFDDKIVSRHRANIAYHRFIVQNSGLYNVKIYYESFSGEQHCFSLPINIDLTKIRLLSDHEIADLANIETINNKLFCDATLLNGNIKKILSFYLYKNDKIISRLRTGEYQHQFSLRESGTYIVKIFYESLDGSQKIIEQIIDFKMRDLITEDKFSTARHHRNIELKPLFNIIYAFIIREFQRKYDTGYLRYSVIIIWPIIQLGFFVFIFTFTGKKTLVGLKIPLFVLTGMLPFNFFSAATSCLTIVAGNRELLSYKQVKIIDIILSHILMEFVIVAGVFSFGLAICIFGGIEVSIYNPLSLLGSFALLFMLTFGLSLIFAVIGYYFAEFNYVIQVIFRILFYISGVLFSIEIIPVQYQKYLLWNPILQLIEFIRFSFVSFYLPHELSYVYLLKCTLIIFLLGISLYFVNRNRFMVNDRAR